MYFIIFYIFTNYYFDRNADVKSFFKLKITYWFKKIYGLLVEL